MKAILGVAVAIVLFSTPAWAEESDDRAAKWVEGIGGKVARDSQQAGKPVIEVNLAGNKKASNDGLKELAGLKCLKRLSFFFDEKISDDGMKHLKGLTSLEELTLNNTGVGDDGLAELKELKALKKLGLAGAIKLTDKSAETINGFTALEELSLPSTITDKGVEKLKALKKVRTFYLGGGMPGDAGVKAICESMPDLESLELGTFGLGGNGVTGASVPALSKLKKLQVLGLAGAKLSEADLKELQSALPKCKIKTR